MKKISFFISILFLSLGSFAQHAPLFGLKGGANFSTFNSNNNVENDLRTSIHVGGLAHIHLNPQWALQPEIQYSSQGTKTDLGNLGEYKWKLDYINVPVMVQYMFDNGFRLEAGPQVGFLVDAKQIDEDDNKEDVKDEFKKVDVGLGFGLSYLTYSGLGLGARYNLGLTDINDNRTYEIRNRVLQVGIFYMFDSRHKAKSR